MSIESLSFDLEDKRPDPDAVAAAGNIISPPPTATPEQLAEAAAQVSGMFEAVPKPPEAPLQDPNLDENTRMAGIPDIKGVQKPLK